MRENYKSNLKFNHRRTYSDTNSLSYQGQVKNTNTTRGFTKKLMTGLSRQLNILTKTVEGQQNLPGRNDKDYEESSRNSVLSVSSRTRPVDQYGGLDIDNANPIGIA